MLHSVVPVDIWGVEIIETFTSHLYMAIGMAMLTVNPVNGRLVVKNIVLFQGMIIITDKEINIIIQYSSCLYRSHFGSNQHPKSAVLDFRTTSFRWWDSHVIFDNWRRAPCKILTRRGQGTMRTMWLLIPQYIFLKRYSYTRSCSLDHAEKSP